MRALFPVSAMCKEGELWKLQREAAVDSALAIQQRFTAYGEELSNMGVFQYLGRLLSHDDNDSQAVRGNLKKARGCWAWIARVLRAENASSRVCAIFYKATVQAVLLFGSETWNRTPTAMKWIKGFHIRVAYRMTRTNKPRRSPNGDWTYSLSEDVLSEVGMHAIADYIAVRRQTIASFIVNRRISCLSARRASGDVGLAPASYGGSNRWTLMRQGRWLILSRLSGKDQSSQRSCK